MNEDENTSRSEIDTQPGYELGSSYMQKLIKQSDLMVTNEEMDLFGEIVSNSFVNNDKNESNKSVLITEVELEHNYNNTIRRLSNEMLEPLVEENDETSQMGETIAQSFIDSQKIFNDGEELTDDSSSEDVKNQDINPSIISKEDLWDTDLEEDFVTSKDRSTTSTYIDLCLKYEVVPVKYYLQNMHKPHLSIKHHGLGPLGAKALAKSLESNITVDILDLSGNWIYHVGATAIGKMLEENNFITKLVLSDNAIGDQGLIGLRNSMQVNRGLRHLDLSGNQITDHGCVELSELIVKSRFLTELVLSKNNIDSKGAQLLATAISSNDILEYLDLSWNKIRGIGAIDIAKGLKENIRIKNCNLSYNGFAKDGGRALAEMIKDNTVLTILNIEANRIDGEIAASIGKALTSNDSLEELRIGYNTMDTNGILSLMSSLNSYDASPLKALYLTDIPIDYEICKVIERIKSKKPDFKCIHGLEIGVGNTKNDINKRLINFKNPIILLQEHVLIKDKRLIDILMKIDEEKNYFVSIDQFGQALQELGIPFKKAQLDIIKNRLDKLGNGTIYYGDFIPKPADSSENEIIANNEE